MCLMPQIQFIMIMPLSATSLMYACMPCMGILTPTTSHHRDSPNVDGHDKTRRRVYKSQVEYHEMDPFPCIARQGQGRHAFKNFKFSR